jgi:hypothetical protein
MKAKDKFFARGEFVIGDGESVRFREDNTWLGNRPLAV